MTKKVSFSGNIEQEITGQHRAGLAFKTWPRSSIKIVSPQRTRKKAGPSTRRDMNSVIDDAYHRFRGLNDIDLTKYTKHLLEGNCANKLQSYSVLNMIFKEAEDTSVITDFDQDEIERVMDVVIADFDAAYNSSDVRDTWTLQQIMRSMEQFWTRCETNSSKFEELAQRCIDLIHDRPGSKTLLSTAMRIANAALERKMLSTQDTVRLIEALTHSHFPFASSFITEAMLILSTVHRSNIDALNESEQTWVPMAVRGLGATSSLTRSLALQLIQYHTNTLPTPESPGLLASCLMQPSEPQRQRSEPLYRVIVRKMASLSAVSYEDAKTMVQAWVLVLQSSFYSEKQWPLLDIWLDIVRVAFSKWPATIPIAWDAIVDAQRVHSSYKQAFVTPLVALQYSEEPASIVTNKIVEAIEAVVDSAQRNSQSDISSEIWDTILDPTFRSLTRFSGAVLSSWAQLLERHLLEMCTSDVSKYLEILPLLVKQISQQYNQQQQNQVQQSRVCSDFETVWVKCVVAGGASKQRVMDLIKFHYTSLSQLANAQNLALMLTNRLIAHLPPNVLTEKPKSSSFEHLTLILLPVVTFMDEEAGGSYIDRVLSSCKSDKTMKIMLRALMATVETGNDRYSKWSLVARAINEYVGSSTEPDSVHLISETLLLFSPLMSKATEQQWQLWGQLLTENRDCQPHVMSVLKKLPPTGIQIILSLPKQHQVSKEDKIRIIRNSFSDEILAMLQKSSGVDSDIIDSVARSLALQGKYDWAVKLLGSSRRFIVAKPLLEAIEKANDGDLIELWNDHVAPFIKNCPPFVPKAQAARLSTEIPNLKIGEESIISSQAVKRPFETPPHSSMSKRPRRTILTGSTQPVLFTPPPSDSAEGSAGKDLCSSPPHNGSPLPKTWKNSVDRARTLKRLMMGLDMDDAVKGMKRSEQQMIYNLMFKSCVWLKTHLAETGPTLPEEDVKQAREELEKTVQRYEVLQTEENSAVEKDKRRAQEAMDESFSDEDLPSDELDIDDDYEDVKIEVD